VNPTNMPAQLSSSTRAFARQGFRWDAADAYLFDIDGTLLNSRDPVHYFAFNHALREVFGVDAKIDGVPVHGNTDIGILRAVLRRHGLADPEIDAGVPQMIEQICAEVRRNAEQMRPELCPSIRELLLLLQQRGKLLAAASGNLEFVGWLKLEKAGLREMFQFGSFSFPLELRADILRQGIRMARKQLDETATVCVVGDTPADIAAAKTAGAPVIAVATGIYSFDDLVAKEPDACFACGTDMLHSLGISERP
jgi:phosphoglycolate phosphatase-like HAD superfamily hydrolase